METLAPFKFWICLAAIGIVLGTVTTLSIRGVPSASNAMIAIRVAQLELFLAKIVFRDPAVHEAEFHLNMSWSNLRDRQYERSFLSAYAALQRVRSIRGGVPSLYSDRRYGEKREPGNSPES